MKKGYLDIEKLTNEGWLLFRNIHTQNSIASEMRKLEYFAAPDVVKVVRCEDCKHWWDKANACRGVETCGGFPEIWEYGLDFYCAFGEHKEDEG